MLYLIRFYEPGSLPDFAKHEAMLESSIRDALGRCEISRDRGRFFVATDDPTAKEKLRKIEGITSFSPAVECRTERLSPCVSGIAREHLRGKRSFAVSVRRSGEHIESSREIAGYLGGEIARSLPGIAVDLDRPEGKIFVEIRGDKSYVFTEVIASEKQRRELPRGEMKFIADEMVGKLAKMLRILGYDVAYMTGVPDIEFIRAAKAEGRLLLTRDVVLSNESGISTLLIRSTDIEEQLAQVMKDLGLKPDRQRMFTRCSEDNTALERAEKGALKGKVPEKVLEEYAEFLRCPKCGRIYWKGSHYDDLMDTLGPYLTS